MELVMFYLIFNQWIFIHVAADVSVPEKIAIDTGTKTIFITDSGKGEIVKIDYNGENIETVLTDGLQKPRGIDLDSESRTVYYSDWGSNPHISKVDYSGNNAVVLVETDIEEPNALAIKGDRLYWCDATKNRIYSIKLDSEDRREELLKQGSHFFDIIIHDEVVYIVNWFGLSSSEVLQYSYDTDQRLSVVAEYENIRVNGVTRICYPETPLSSGSSTSTSTTTTTTTASTTTTITTTATTHSNQEIDDSHSSTQTLTSTLSTMVSNPESSRNSDNASDRILIIAISVGIGGIILGILVVITTLCIRKRTRKAKNNARKTKHRSGPLPPALPEPISPDASPRPVTRAATYVKPAQLQNELNPYQGTVHENSMKAENSDYDSLGIVDDDNTYMDVIGDDQNEAKSADEIYVYIDDKDLNKY